MGKIFTKFSETPKRKKLRNEPTRAEIALWREINSRRLNGYKFRRQHSIGPFVIDFYCPAMRLAIEVDGNSHFLENVEIYEARREKFIKDFGVKMLRFTNTEVFKNRESVVEIIRGTLAAPPPTPPRKGGV